MKKFVAFFLATVMIMSMSVETFAAKIGPGLYGENIEWYWDDSTKTLSILGSDKMENYSDPSRRAWNDLEDQVEHLIIGDEVTYVGRYSFYDMDNLKDVVIGSAVTKIDDYAFKSCENLTGNVDFKNVTYIGEECFINTSISGINFGKVSTVCKNAFAYNNTIETLNIPSGITFDRGTFNQCNSLKKVSIDSNVSDAMFNECTALTDVIIGSNVKSIGGYAFYLDTALKNLTVNEGLETIGEWAFNNSAFHDVILPSTVKEIDYASLCGLNPTYLTFCEGDSPIVTEETINPTDCHYIYKTNKSGWNDIDKAAGWDGQKTANVSLDLSIGNIYMYCLDDGSYGYVNGTNFYMSDSNKITINQSNSSATENRIFIVNGNFEVTLNNVNVCHVGGGEGWITMRKNTSVVINLPENTYSIINNAGDTTDGYYASGISGEDNTTVTFKGTGKIDIIGSDNRYGIICTNININSGTIFAKGGFYASGICATGTATINNGTVKATGCNLGAGIEVWTSSTLIINGGDITAIGGMDGAGIGGRGLGGNCGTVKINAGNVYARGGDFYDNIKGADIGVGGTGTTAEYLYISKNAKVDAQYIGDYFHANADEIFKKVEVEDVSVISNLISIIKQMEVETPEVPETPTEPTTPETPVEPETPTEPTTPETPTETTTPTVDDDPIVEDIPDEPEDPEFNLNGRTYTIKIESAETTTSSRSGRKTVAINLTVKLHRNDAKKACTLIFATYDKNGRYLGMKTATVKKGTSKDISVKCAIDNTKGKVATIKLMSISIDGGSLYMPLGPASTVYVK